MFARPELYYINIIDLKWEAMQKVTHSARCSSHVHSDATIPHVVFVVMIGTFTAPRHPGRRRGGGIWLSMDGGITIADSVVHGDTANGRVLVMPRHDRSQVIAGDIWMTGTQPLVVQCGFPEKRKEKVNRVKIKQND